MDDVRGRGNQRLGEIECGGTVTKVAAGDIMYCAGNVMHGITNTGVVPMTFYWSKWLAR